MHRLRRRLAAQADAPATRSADTSGVVRPALDVLGVLVARSSARECRTPRICRARASAAGPRPCSRRRTSARLAVAPSTAGLPADGLGRAGRPDRQRSGIGGRRQDDVDRPRQPSAPRASRAVSTISRAARDSRTARPRPSSDGAPRTPGTVRRSARSTPLGAHAGDLRIGLGEEVRLAEPVEAHLHRSRAASWPRSGHLDRTARAGIRPQQRSTAAHPQGRRCDLGCALHRGDHRGPRPADRAGDGSTPDLAEHPVAERLGPLVDEVHLGPALLLDRMRFGGATPGPPSPIR